MNDIYFRDRVGTVINVVGDAFGAAIISHLSKSDLEKVPDIPAGNPAVLNSNQAKRSENLPEAWVGPEMS